MIKNASNYFFEMTKHFLFKSVKIIIPKIWKKNSNYSRLKTESYDKADVIIADPYMKHVDDPYTLQYGGCKEKGQYIHFTPNFLLNDNLFNVDGEKGRVFVNKWAHFRWGVFDKYSTDMPFYVSRNSEAASVEATSCPAGVTGIPVFPDCSRDTCEPRSCRYDGQLSENGCIFIPDIPQNISCSVMYLQYIPSAVEFCDKTTHNSEAPNMQNKICNHKSTWEVIMESDDFRNSAVVNASAPPSETTFRLLQTQDRAVALVLDVSGSMTMSCLSGGLKLYAVDKDVPCKLIETFSAITSGSGDISEQSIQLESEELVVQHSGWMNTTVPIDKTAGKNTFFSIVWSLSQTFFFLRDTKGKEYGSSDFTIDHSNPNTARLSISGTAEAGDWQFCIKNVHRATQAISVTPASQPACPDVPPVSIAAHMNRANTAFSPVVYAEVSQGFLPVLGATVIATIEKDGAAAVTLELLDNGAGADMMKNDGIYSRYFTSLQGTGRYSLKVNACGRNTTTRLSLKQNQALYIPGYRENGKIYMNAPRPKLTDEEMQVKLGSFSRISTSSLVVNTGGDSAPIYLPCKVTDLHAHIENKTIVLSWTAAGGDFDNGKADHYIIKSSENLQELRNNFDSATSVSSSNLIPKEACREESFKIKPENFTIENDTTIYFAIRAIDDTNLISEVSNIAQATWFIPPKASTPLEYDSNDDGAKSTVIVAIAVLCVVVVCTIVSSTLCVLQKQKERLDIETMQKHV
ncbi:LOW QUALITY PROTEIN: calcium-activated chloride channel regulator 1-like [Cariama cristata]